MGRLILCIDPSTDWGKLGWACFRPDTGRLFAAGRGTTIRDAVERKVLRVETLVIEIPQIYERRKGKGNPNLLIRLALRAGEIKGSIWCTEALTPLPHDWKGSIDKAKHNRQTLNKLTDHERAIVGTNHNVIDAAGLGLWYLEERGLRK